MMRAEKFEFTCLSVAFPCDACGEALCVWLECPYPGHNISALYECQGCHGVFTLADVTGGHFELLPGST